MKIVRRVLYIFTVIRYMNLNRVSFSSLNLLPLDQRPIQYVTLRFFMLFYDSQAIKFYFLLH